jgi:hypothetical protein
VSSNSEAAAKTVAAAGGIVGLSLNSTNTITYCASLNPLLMAESAATQSYAYRVMGGVYNSTVSVLGPDDNKNINLANNYALPDMEVRTKQGDGEWTNIPQQPNNTANLMGSGNMEQTQAFFEGALGWNFEVDWTWDAEANLPVPRYN